LISALSELVDIVHVSIEALIDGPLELIDGILGLGALLQPVLRPRLGDDDALAS